MRRSLLCFITPLCPHLAPQTTTLFLLYWAICMQSNFRGNLYGLSTSFCVCVSFHDSADVHVVVAMKALGSKKATKLKSHTHLCLHICMNEQRERGNNESCLKYENWNGKGIRAEKAYLSMYPMEFYAIVLYSKCADIVVIIARLASLFATLRLCILFWLWNCKYKCKLCMCNDGGVPTFSLSLSLPFTSLTLVKSIQVAYGM